MEDHSAGIVFDAFSHNKKAFIGHTSFCAGMAMMMRLMLDDEFMSNQL